MLRLGTQQHSLNHMGQKHTDQMIRQRENKEIIQIIEDKT